MRKYKCHKVVEAGKILTIIEPHTMAGSPWEFIIEGHIGRVAVMPEWYARHKPEKGGYVVVYEDTYMSYSPGAAFESGYALIVGAASATYEEPRDLPPEQLEAALAVGTPVPVGTPPDVEGAKERVAAARVFRDPAPFVQRAFVAMRRAAEICQAIPTGDLVHGDGMIPAHMATKALTTLAALHYNYAKLIDASLIELGSLISEAAGALSVEMEIADHGATDYIPSSLRLSPKRRARMEETIRDGQRQLDALDGFIGQRSMDGADPFSKGLPSDIAQTWPNMPNK